MHLKKSKKKTATKAYHPLPLNFNYDDPSSFVCGDCTSAPPPTLIDNSDNKTLSLLIDKGAVQFLQAIPTVTKVSSEECGSNCLVTVEYYSKQTLDDSQRDTNPQEAIDSDNAAAAENILSKLTSKGYSFTVVDTTENASSQTPYDKSNSKPTVRTRLHITSGLCCPTEIPIIKSLLKPLSGVVKIGVNVATKVAWVDHTDEITAKEMKNVLEKSKFSVEILKDGASQTDIVGAALQAERSKFVESTLLLKGDIVSSGATPKEVIEKLIWQKFNKTEIRALSVNVSSRTLKVEHDPELVGVVGIKELIAAGFAESRHVNAHDWEVQVLRDGAVEDLTLPASSEADLQLSATPDKESIFAGLRLNVVISGIFWFISLLSVIDEDLDYLECAGIVSVISGMPPVLVKACMTMRRCKFDANCMMVIAAFGSLALGEYDEAASVSFLFAVSEWLEAQATSKARRALGEIVSLRPDYAHVIDESSGKITIIPAENVPLGSLVSVRTGDKVPADGIVKSGSSSVDESSITGEARPVYKTTGNEVSAGAINVGSTQLVVKTTSTADDSTLSRLIALVEEAQTNRSETEKLVDSFAQKYTPFVLATALLVCTIPWVFGVETGRHWTLNGLIIIVIACPCALTISTPVTYSAGLAACARKGIIIKGGSRLEALGNVKTAIFDKTGTLTQGRFILDHLEIIGEHKSRREVLELLAVMEAPSSHPLSEALVSAAKVEGIETSKTLLAQHHTILKGEGVCAKVRNQRVYVGNERLFKRIEMYDNLSQHHLELNRKWNSEGGTIGFIGIEGLGVIAMYCVTDSVREEAQHVVTTMKNSGITVIMLTGDGDGAAQAIGKKVVLPSSNIKSQFLPEDKMHYVSSLKDNSSRSAGLFSSGKDVVMMVGDGVNDAPALAIADVSVAMGQGASMTLEMSDITLMDSDLNKLLFGMKMGSKVITTVKENIVFSLITNAAAVGLTFAGKMTLLLAIVCDVGVMLMVTMNGMKLLSERNVRSIEARSLKASPSSSRSREQYEAAPSGDEDFSYEEDDDVEIV